MGPSNRSACRLREYIIHRDAKADRVEALYNPLRSRASHLPQLGESRIERREIAEVQPKKVRLPRRVYGAQLDTRDDTDTGARPGGSSLMQARDRIVVGYRNRIEARLPRGDDEGSRRRDAVGGSRMRVKVDEAGTATLRRRAGEASHGV